MTLDRSTERRVERALRFRRCPQCSYDFATGTGTRGCELYSCPYLPDVLDVFCPTCVYNFYTGEGRPECNDPPDCEFARREAPVRVEGLRRWLDVVGSPERAVLSAEPQATHPVHVLRTRQGWLVTRVHPQFNSSAETLEEATAAARRLAQRDRATVLVHDTGGEIVSRESYASEPTVARDSAPSSGRRAARSYLARSRDHGD